MRPIWGVYWREREYIADQYAASLGQAEDLVEFLELHALIHDQPVPWLWLTEHTHPPTALRIDRLRGAEPDIAIDQPAILDSPEASPMPASSQAPSSGAGTRQGPPLRGRLRRGLTARPLTEPVPCAAKSIRSAGTSPADHRPRQMIGASMLALTTIPSRSPRPPRFPRCAAVAPPRARSAHDQAAGRGAPSWAGRVADRR